MLHSIYSQIDSSLEDFQSKCKIPVKLRQFGYINSESCLTIENILTPVNPV